MDKELTGTLFKNTNKKNDKQPEYTGMAHIEGKKYRVSAWVNIASSGSKYISLRYKEDLPEGKSEQERPVDTLDDEILF